MRIATSVPTWGHNKRVDIAARLFDHIDTLLDGPEVRGFPKGRPRRCRVYVARIRAARKLLGSEVVLSTVGRRHLDARVTALERTAREGGWL